jgi:cytosine/uracil/thiamine/allantoin permease
MELQMAYLDDARHSGRNTYVSGGHPWPREFVTLALVAGCVAFWAILVLAISDFS